MREVLDVRIKLQRPHLTDFMFVSERERPVAVTGDNIELAQETIGALNGRAALSTHFPIGHPPVSSRLSPVSLELPATRRQGPRGNSISSRRWVTPQTIQCIPPISDFVFICLASLAFFAPLVNGIQGLQHYIFTSIAIAAVFMAIFDRVGGYQPKQLRRWVWQATSAVIVWFLTIVIICFFASANPITAPAVHNNFLVYWALGMPLFLLLYKLLCTNLFEHLARVGYFARNVVIIGAGKHAEGLIRKLRSAEPEQLNIRGLFDDRRGRIPTAIEGVPVRGTTDDLIDFVRREAIDEVLIALPLADGERLISLRHKLQTLAIDARLSIEPLPGDFRARTVDYLGNVRVLDVVERPLKGWDGIVKVILDKLLSLICLICFIPLMLLTAALIKLDSRGPVFFVQKRFGRNNCVINVLKFRTMHLSHGDPSGQRRTIRNDPRVTRVGRALRRLSLDELPQLINVIRGDMSLVGPRPHAIAMMAGDQLYHEVVADYPRRHRVKPGITGWAQVNGSRGEIDTLAKAHTRVQLDLYYINHWSVWLDVRILLKTASLLLCKGAY